MSTIDVGLSPDEALRRASEFLRGLREGKISPADTPLNDASIDALHAACRVLAEPNAGGIEDPLASVRALYDFIEKITWPAPDFDERAELLAACAFAGWRIALLHARPPVTDGWQERLTAVTPKMLLLRNRFPADSVEADEVAIHPQAKTDPVPIPETLLPLLDQLRSRCESGPEGVYQETTFLYGFLEALEPKYPLDAFLLDEREYFLGETARIVGAVCRHLARRDEARRWLDLSDAWFLLTENAAGNLSKVQYQRLALKVEERDFEPVLELLPRLVASFERLGMQEDAIKARFLEGNILREVDRSDKAVEVFREIVASARSLRHDSLLAIALVNLVQLTAMTGQVKESLAFSTEATPLLRKLGNRIGIAKLQWGMGYLLRNQDGSVAAIDAYRAAQKEFSELGMRADVAAVQLIIADILIDENQEKQAEWEIRQALPLIEEYKLVPEGFAAMTLLRESLRRQKIDRQALRNLHGYFEELQG